MEKMPPKEKIFEAWTAIDDDRISVHEGYATVRSSDGTKEYTIKFSEDSYSSNDNATYWRGYAGYPVIALLMLQGRLPFDKEEAQKWSDVNWKEINKKNKNDYAKAVSEVAAERNIDMKEADMAAEKVMEALSELQIKIKRKI